MENNSKKLYESCKDLLDKIPACCLYCENTYRACDSSYLFVEDFDLSKELEMRASLPSEKCSIVHCDLLLKFVDTSYRCEQFRYRCSILQEAYEYKKELLKKKKDNSLQLKMF